MNDKLLFDFLRRKKGEWTRNSNARLTQAEVDEWNAVLKAAREPLAELTTPTPSSTLGLKTPATFWAQMREALGPFSQSQVDGFIRLMAPMGIARWPISWVAYGLATAWWETAHSMEPVQEGYYLGGSDRVKRFQRTLRYYPWFGRGDVQLTWERNYQKADEELGLGGALLRDPDLALDPTISAKILVKGMEQGWFTAKRLADYLPLSGPASHSGFKAARRIINGQDKADEIARIATSIQKALEYGEWA